MADNNAVKSSACLKKHGLRATLSGIYEARLEMRAARLYSDDADLRQGALSAPDSQLRPGLRDDEVRNPFVRLIPAL